MTALQMMKYHLKNGGKLTYCDVNTRDGVIRAEFPVPQATGKMVRFNIKRHEQENLAMVRRRRK